MDKLMNRSDEERRLNVKWLTEHKEEGDLGGGGCTTHIVQYLHVYMVQWRKGGGRGYLLFVQSIQSQSN